MYLCTPTHSHSLTHIQEGGSHAQSQSPDVSMYTISMDFDIDRYEKFFPKCEVCFYVYSYIYSTFFCIASDEW
jgi:hypothetical protein